MRFSAAITLPPLQRPPELAPAPPVRAQYPERDEPLPWARELPAELDQRVRETGEW